MAGQPRQALQITELAHERGADLGMMLQDLLELTAHGHPPEVGAGAARQPGTARGRAHPRRGAGRPAVGAGAGARLADAAEGRRRGGDRAGPPRRRRDGADPALPCLRPAAARRSGAAADADGAAQATGAPAGRRRRSRWRRARGRRRRADRRCPTPTPTPRLASFRDVTALVAERREAMLHAHLIHSVHLVRFAPPVIELRPQPEAPRDLAPRLGALLAEATGTRWTIALSDRRGRADRRRTGHRRRCRATRGRRRSSAGARDHGCVPRRAHRHGA